MPLLVISEAMSKKLQETTRLYLDTNIFIYFLEGDQRYNDAVEQVFRCCEEFNIAVFTSEITIAECLIGPYKKKSVELIQKYESFFEKTGDAISIVPVESSILWDAPNIAVQYGLKLIDAVHVTTAFSCGCDGFVTNDNGIGPFENKMITVNLTDDIIDAHE